jgi:hypothetical protein
MSRWARQFSRVGRDGYQLARAVVQNRSSFDIKPVLLEHARQANTVASSLLQVDKQVGLVKYYGLSGYLKQRLQSTAVAPTSTDTTTIATTDTAQSSGAKVAFMVTVSMKQELNEGLGYDADQIKQMTPLQASLILNHSIPPEAMEERLPVAEQEYEAQRQKEAEEQERMRIQKEQEERLQSKMKETIAAQESLSSEFSSTTSYFVHTGSYASSNLLEEPSGASWWGDVWFEVTETIEDGETTRVGLYLDEEEAKLGMQTRQEIADRKGIPTTFELHQLSGKDSV